MKIHFYKVEPPNIHDDQTRISAGWRLRFQTSFAAQSRSFWWLPAAGKRRFQSAPLALR